MDHIIDQLVKFLEQFQNPNGSFSSYSSSTENFEKPDFTYTTICTTAFVLHAMANIKDVPRVASIKKRAALFLLQNKSPYATWNYWSHENHEYTHFPYPDDTDDTFAALSALYRYDSKTTNGTCLAQVVDGLTAIEKSEGGPYYTWYTKSKKRLWKDVDCVANAQIAYFLHLQEIHLPQMNKYFEKITNKKTFESPYYPSPLHCMYFVARSYTNKHFSHMLQGYIESHIKHLNPLELALAISSMRYHNNKVTFLLKRLIKQCKNLDVCTRAYPFCIDPMRNGKKYYSGSPAITAAAIVEALSLSIESIKQASPTLASSIFSVTHKRIVKLASRFPKHLQNNVKELIRSALETEAGKQCVTAPILVAEAFGNMPLEQLKEICFAQACGWIAYEVFDDCVDEKKTDDLGIALILYADMRTIFSKIFADDAHFLEEFSMRCANMNISLLEEAHHISTKDPTTSDQLPHWMVHKSAGYLIGPLAVMHSLGYPMQSDTTQKIKSYFEKCILALQLSDDAHDWEDDMKTFRRNGIVEMLPKLQTIPKNTRHQYFWGSGIDCVLENIQSKCEDARKAYLSLSKVKNISVLEIPIRKIEMMIDKTEQSRNVAREFLKEYRGT